MNSIQFLLLQEFKIGTSTRYPFHKIPKFAIFVVVNNKIWLNLGSRNHSCTLRWPTKDPQKSYSKQRSENDKKNTKSLFPQMAPKSNFMNLFVSFSFEPSDPVQFGKISRNLKYCHKYLWTSLNSYLGNITTHIWHFFHGSFCLCAIFIFCRSLLFFFALFFLLFELLHPNDCGGRFFLPKLRKLCLLSLIACKIGFWF